MKKSIIELEQIHFAYPNSSKGLDNISLEIPEGEKTVVLGLNGAGKSTLFLMLCGILKPNKGSYLLENSLFGFSKKECRQIGRRIGYVFQDPEVQLFAPTVYEDVAFGLHNMGCPEEELKEKVEDCLAFLNISHLKDCAPHELSYGQKKLVAIAGILVMNPKVLILDEPFAWLDNVQENNMRTILNQLHERGMTIVLSTHNLDFAFSWATYGILLEQGKCVEQGIIEQLSEQRDRLWK